MPARQALAKKCRLTLAQVQMHLGRTGGLNIDLAHVSARIKTRRDWVILMTRSSIARWSRLTTRSRSTSRSLCAASLSWF